MGLVLQYVKQTKNGGFHYRRRVPQDIEELIGKREFKSVLGASRAEALKVYSRVHSSVQREIASARAINARQAAALGGKLGGLALRDVVERRVAALLVGLDDPDEFRGIVADSILDSYPREDSTEDMEGEPVGVSAVDSLTVNLLRNPLAPLPKPTLQDACDLYLRDKLDATNPEEHLKATQHLNRAFKLVEETLGGLPELAALRREDARKVRDHMLRQLKSNGQPISPASVRRNLSVVNSVINHALREMDLRNTVTNPFSELPVKGVDGNRGAETSDADNRVPLPPNVLEKVRAQIFDAANSELGLIWRILQGTGCRLAEVTGLRVEDVTVDGDLPNICVRWNENRRLKGKASIRHVPLVGESLEAAKEAVALAGSATMLFERYGRSRGADAASAALMKHIRIISGNPLHVVHSLRHNMKDALVEAEISSLEQNLILGHALGGVGDRVYGGTPAKLRVTKKALEIALKVGRPR